jgi:predicted RNA binding protein YcfA (HicA-like mRNA interferase family)
MAKKNPKKGLAQRPKPAKPPLERDSKKILARLKKEGWTVERVKGSHHQLKRPGTKKLITLSHPTKSLPTGTARQIHKIAGWPV